MPKFSKAERDEVRATLLSLLKPGDTVYTRLNHVSRSGMSRSITPLIIDDGAPRYIAWSAGVLLGLSRDRYDGLTIGGCGMDMGFSLVYSLGWALFPEGFGLPMEHPDTGARKPAPKTKAAAEKLYALGYRARGRNGDDSGWDTDGGYSLEQRWI